jgi:hypothetical protein
MPHPHDAHEWLSLVDVSGPFLAVPVLEKAFPQGLEGLDPRKKKDLRQAYDEWREAQDLDDEHLGDIHRAWINLVLEQTLELDDEVLRPRSDLPESLSYHQPEYGVTVQPDYAVVDDQEGDKPLMLISVYEQDVDLDSVLEGDGWATSPAERMGWLCRSSGTRLALVTNGERWMLIDAPDGGVTTYASWYARLWSQEPLTLQAFLALLGVGRFFDATDRQLPALFDESLKHQDEVTDALGEQVRRAVEVLVQALDRADVDRNRELLEGVDPSELYEAALTVMMRLVFLLSAEERELMDVVKDERFEANYAVSSLRMQLRDQAGLHSEEILSHRRDAWSRLLAIFRAVYGGIEHETLRMPALGGSLFDPDRFPFLEGRAKGTNWQADEAKPLPIDNRTVLLLLDAIQLFQGRTLSYRALDVENIGYVYEGLLERTVERAQEVILGLDATKSAKKPWVTLDELESAHANGLNAVEKLLKERTGSSINRVCNDLRKTVDPSDSAKLLTACHNDRELCDRIERYFHLLRIDDWGYPLVYPEGTFMVTTGTDRRETGTHYTPKSLTEAIVKETLEPVVYDGPAQGTARDEWRLKSPGELLDLKICDPAMGSGAFLVQVCRWLSERLVESWEKEQANGRFIDVDGEVHDETEGLEALPKESEERMITARRLIAERCLYGVDINPMAVELAKLSIWLVTLSKGRPFGFLDHNLRSGDSLLGIHDLQQLIQLHPDPEEGERLHAGLLDHRDTVRKAVEQALSKRLEVRTHRIRDISDVQEMSRLNDTAQESLGVCHVIADAVMGEALGNPATLREGLVALAVSAGECLNGDEGALRDLRVKAREQLATDHPSADGTRHPFHWALEFPEVFLREKAGFDAIVGNPPFLGGQKITGAFGEKYREFLVEFVGNSKRGSADLVAYFFTRSSALLSVKGIFGLLAVNTIAEGDTRDVGLAQLEKMGVSTIAAYADEPWPGSANVVTSRVHAYKGNWIGSRRLNNQPVDYISPYLTSRQVWSPVKLMTNKNLAFQGSVVLGMGFTLDPEKTRELLGEELRYRDILFPYLIGKEVNQSPSQEPGRWVISFWDWPEAKARRFNVAFSQVERMVKPERFALKDNPSARGYKKYWWLHGKNGKAWLHRVGRGQLFDSHPRNWEQNKKLSSVIVFATGATKYPVFTFVPNEYIFANTVCVVASESYSLFACLSSDIHVIWAWEHGSRMKQDLRYTHGDIFETFPFPNDVLEGEIRHLVDVGLEYFERRREYMLANRKGMTKFYNDFHDPELEESTIQEFRSLQVEVNNRVLAAYGWTDIEPDYAFHKVGYLPDGKNVRYTVSEEARKELLYRLAILNKERYEEEVKQGFHAKKKTKKKAAAKKKTKAKVYEIPAYQERELPKVAEPSQMDLLGASTEPAGSGAGNQWGNNPVDQIFAWLEANSGWHAKQVILNGCQAEPGSWDGAIEELLNEGFVEADGATLRYRAVP